MRKNILPSNNQRISIGFTLIELLVVVLIISIVVTTALLTMRRFMHDQQVETAAKELATIIPVAQQQAILQPAVIGLKVNTDNYAFYRFIINSKNNTGSWQLIARDRVLTNKILPAKVKLAITMQGRDLLTVDKNNQTPQVIFFPSGDMTPFTIMIGVNEQSAAYSLIGKANGSVILNSLNK